MSEEHEDGIVLENTFPLDESSPIDWDTVLRDFVWVHSLAEEQEATVDDLLHDLAESNLTLPVSLPNREKVFINHNG